MVQIEKREGRAGSEVENKHGGECRREVRKSTGDSSEKEEKF